MNFPSPLLVRLIFYYPSRSCLFSFFFFFNDTATTEIYTLSLHDALPILLLRQLPATIYSGCGICSRRSRWLRDRKSTRLNSSHSQISYAVFCLKKKKNDNTTEPRTH